MTLVSAPAGLSDALQRLEEVSDRGVSLLDGSGGEQQRSWAAVHAEGARVAGGLVARGVRPGDRVALMFDTSWELLGALLGCWLAGAAPAPLYPPVRMGRLDEWIDRTARMLDLADARMLLTSGLALPWVGQVVARARLPLGALAPGRLGSGAPSQEAHPDDALGLVQFSSGTTGKPKAVALTRGALLAQVHCLTGPILRAYPDYAHAGSGCGWLPLYHDMGLIGLFLTPLVYRRPLTLTSPQHFLRRPALWLQALSRSRATVSVAPNFAYALCTERIRPEELDGVDLSSWRVALNGAEPIAGDTLRRFAARFAANGLRPEALTPVYGLSEAALAVTFAPVAGGWTSTRFDREALGRGEAVVADDGIEVVSCGRPIPGCAIEVRVDGEPAQDRVGVLHVRSPSLMQGYLKDEPETRRVLVDGWLDTGDRAVLHRGELYLLGRERDVLILRGQNCDPTPLERAVDALPGVRVGCSAAVSFRPEDHDTEILVVLVERAREATPAQLAELPGACARAIAGATGHQPDLVEVLEPGALPRTSSGKIRRAEARRRFQDGSLTAPAAVTRRYLAARALASGVGWVRRWLQ